MVPLGLNLKEGHEIFGREMETQKIYEGEIELLVEEVDEIKKKVNKAFENLESEMNGLNLKSDIKMLITSLNLACDLMETKCSNAENQLK